MTFLAIIVFLGYLVFNISLMLLSTHIILPETLVNEHLLEIVIGLPIGITYVRDNTFAIFYVCLVGCILLAYSFIFYTGWHDLISYIKNVFRRKFRKPEEYRSATSSPVLRLVTVFTAILFIMFVYNMTLVLTGRGIETPERFLDMPAWEMIFTLTEAAVWEEIIVRVAYIGLPMFIYALAKGRKNFTKYLLGGFGFEERFPAILVLTSSIIFAAAHLPGWGWNPIKAGQVLPISIFIGYLFAKDGLHSAILIHFFVDYLGSVSDMLLDVPALNMSRSLMLLFLGGIGVYYTYKYVSKFIHWFQKNKKKNSMTRKRK